MANDAPPVWMDRMIGRRVAVIGDAVLDSYIYGNSDRVSREAPVLIVQEDARENRLGGAANTAANLVALGAETEMVGFVGDDEAGTTLRALLADKGIGTEGIRASPNVCTLTKTRILAGSLHTTKQQILRLDRVSRQPIEDTERRAFFEQSQAILDSCEAIIVSEYGDGLMSDLFAELARPSQELNRVVVVDSRYNLKKYHGVTAVTPNEPETEAILGRSLRSERDAIEAAEELVASLGLVAALVTRGREGMAVAQQGQPSLSIAAHGSRDAVDVTGAGDTVAACFCLALTAGASVEEAARLANLAASVVVGQIGAATCDRATLGAMWALK
jgi:D-glycero-beta-D-manno-heptose-7-phosphate kinase